MKKYLARCSGEPCFVVLKKGKACFYTTGKKANGNLVLFRSGCADPCDIEWVDKPPKKLLEACELDDD